MKYIFTSLLFATAMNSTLAMESCNWEIFTFAGQIFKEAVVSFRFKCGDPSPSDKLFAAINASNVTEVATLLMEYPQLANFAEDAEGKSPLLAATIVGNPSIVAQILNRQPQVDRVTHQGFTLIEIKGASRPKALTQWQCLAGLTPLMAAALLNHVDIAKQLLSAGAKKDLQDLGRPKRTAFDYAQENGNIQMLDLVRLEKNSPV